MSHTAHPRTSDGLYPTFSLPLWWNHPHPREVKCIASGQIVNSSRRLKQNPAPWMAVQFIFLQVTLIRKAPGYGHCKPAPCSAISSSGNRTCIYPRAMGNWSPPRHLPLCYPSNWYVSISYHLYLQKATHASSDPTVPSWLWAATSSINREVSG